MSLVLYSEITVEHCQYECSCAMGLKLRINHNDSQCALNDASFRKLVVVIMRLHFKCRYIKRYDHTLRSVWPVNLSNLFPGLYATNERNTQVNSKILRQSSDIHLQSPCEQTKSSVAFVFRESWIVLSNPQGKKSVRINHLMILSIRLCIVRCWFQNSFLHSCDISFHDGASKFDVKVGAFLRWPHMTYPETDLTILIVFQRNICRAVICCVIIFCDELPLIGFDARDAAPRHHPELNSFVFHLSLKWGMVSIRPTSPLTIAQTGLTLEADIEVTGEGLPMMLPEVPLTSTIPNPSATATSPTISVQMDTLSHQLSPDATEVVPNVAASHFKHQFPVLYRFLLYQECAQISSYSNGWLNVKPFHFGHHHDVQSVQLFQVIRILCDFSAYPSIQMIQLKSSWFLLAIVVCLCFSATRGHICSFSKFRSFTNSFSRRTSQRDFLVAILAILHDILLRAGVNHSDYNGRETCPCDRCYSMKPLSGCEASASKMSQESQQQSRSRNSRTHLSFLISIALFDAIGIHHFIFERIQFDHTKGFPGEGPTENDTWKCISANIDSVATHPHCFQWQHDAIFLQETRVASSNIDYVSKTVSQSGRTFHTSKLLQHKQQKNGTFRIPHGGTAIVASSSLMWPFTQADDVTGRWSEIVASSRISAAWIQILPKLRALVFSFYGYPFDRVDEYGGFESNNALLQNIFEISSQYGDIPIIVAGDFQLDPSSYPAFQSAKNFGWTDPITKSDELGNNVRPLTYSHQGNFDNPESQCSSIDGILLNAIAQSALVKVEVVYGDARQHTPVQADFKWPKVFQKGFVIERPAPFCLNGLRKTSQGNIDYQHLEEVANQLWEESFQTKCSNVDDNLAWDAVNRYGITILQEAGAKFEIGPKTRGHKHRFKPKIVCPGQQNDGSAQTRKCASLSKLHALISELRCRLARQCNKFTDMLITLRLQEKVDKRIAQIPHFQGWDKDVHMNDQALFAIQKSLQSQIVEIRVKEKYERIGKWKEKMKHGTSSKNVDKTVYQWIKNKQETVTPNHIRDQSGNIIHDPIEAMHTINLKWDEIYSSNVLHEDPMKILSFVWPYLNRYHNPVTLPPLTGNELKSQILKRKTSAAPGLDGWRTVECKVLPEKFYDCVAKYFEEIENGTRHFPHELAAAKQVILDKPHSDGSPLQKRLITILPIFYLAYSGLRYQQLQEWQLITLPPQLYGGIKSRKLTDVQNSIQLDIDTAKAKGEALVGMKLDKSKCFDRLLPDVTAALFTAFGLPKGFVRYFTLMYHNLHRYIAYNQWMSTTPTTCANGLAQGCSISLLAINLHMAVWIIFVQRFHVSSAAFIDDSYLWAKIENICWIEKALEATSYWDTLTGQKLNPQKCQIWASTAHGRKLIKKAFHDMELVHTIEVLGARIQTTELKAYGWKKEKTDKIRKDIKNISSIPCSREVKSHIIASKIIPQITFSAHINGVPKDVLQSMQDQIAAALWGNRPKWRSKLLLLGLISKPHGCDPILARSYNMILDTMTFLKNGSSNDRQRWENQFLSERISPNSMMAHFAQACTCIGIKHSETFKVTIWDSEALCFLDFSRRDFKLLLQHLCRHICYSNASSTTRKDLSICQGILDYSVTSLAASPAEKLHYGGKNLACHRDSILVGCTITNDRAYAANFVESAECRFCGKTKESIMHIVRECEALPDELRKPALPLNLGPNFDCFGIAETSLDNAKKALRVSNPTQIPYVQWNQQTTRDPCQVWVDGSVDDQQLFFHQKGGFAIVDASGNKIFAGPVYHINLSAYTTELWAAIVAFVSSAQPIHIHSDCQTVVKQINEVIQTRQIPFCWSHISWWIFFNNVLCERMNLIGCSPLKIEWCKAHQVDNVPSYMLTWELAEKLGTTVNNLRGNKFADYFAKQAVREQKQNLPQIDGEAKKSIIEWQLWLAKINAWIGGAQNCKKHKNFPKTDDGVAKKHPLPHEICTFHTIEDFRNLLPKWNWTPNQELYTWVPQCDFVSFPNSYVNISQCNWDKIVLWLKVQKWKPIEGSGTSWLEMAVQAFFAGVKLEDLNTPKSYVNAIQKVINSTAKIDASIQLVPSPRIKKCKANGKTHPMGMIPNFEMFVSPDALKFIATQMLRGRDHTPNSWNFPFPNTDQYG